mgnify:CR=1 FL=1
MKYDFQAIEKKWQKVWDDEKAFAQVFNMSYNSMFDLVKDYLNAS